MKQLVFATNNHHKLHEIQALAGSDFLIRTLKEIGCEYDIPETADTLEGNALLKAEFIHKRYKTDCFADDTGLEIEALDGKPGVYSARYAGNAHDFEANIDKVLSELHGKNNRKARFRTVIALIINGETHIFEGIVNGTILESRRGIRGFGYDPVFVPDGHNETFAEMDLSEKNKISHRAVAVQKLVDYLKSP